MSKKILFFVGCIFFLAINFTYLFADEKNLVPLKKPLLTDKEKKAKISINTLRPLPKPIRKTSTEKVEKTFVKENKETKKAFILPKKKPIIAGVKKKEKIVTSKFYSKKDFALAKKAISEMKKANWPMALKTAKKARDKSIYNFIQWRHLLTKGNKSSFYDYKIFIDANENYPRINRIKYLAEHKLSNDKISPKKIINWFGSSEPLSGYGKMILGESYIMTGNNIKGIEYIKEGWITADLSKSDLKFFRKKFKKYLNAEDYIKRADYLAWNNKYWDLKRMLRYLPKDYELLYTARQLLIVNLMVLIMLYQKFLKD